MKKYRKTVMGIVGSGVALGVGSSVLSSVGSTEGSKAMGNLSSSLPMLGTLGGSAATLRALKKLKR